MKKEKQVKSYKRRTKSGKTVTVKAHTAKYEAADEKAKEVSKKPGAGKELEERKKKPVQLETPFGKEEEKKVLDEVKETTKKESSKKLAEKKTSKKVRPVGSGTNGPEPKSNNDPVKRGNKVTVKGKTYYVHEDKIYDKNGERVRFSKKDGTLGDSIRMKSARMDANAQNATDSERSQRATKRKEEQKASLRKSAPIEKAAKRKAANEAAKSKSSEPAFTAAEFKEWYRGTGSAADKKVAKALRAHLGRSGYRKLEDEAIDNYTSRGHLSMFKRVSGGSSTSAKPKSSLGTKKGNFF